MFDFLLCSLLGFVLLCCTVARPAKGHGLPLCLFFVSLLLTCLVSAAAAEVDGPHQIIDMLLPHELTCLSCYASRSMTVELMDDKSWKSGCGTDMGLSGSDDIRGTRDLNHDCTSEVLSCYCLASEF